MLLLLVAGVGMGGGGTVVEEAVIGGLPTRRYILPNGMRVTATLDEIDRYLLPFTIPERQEAVAASVEAKPRAITKSTVTASPVVPVLVELDNQQALALLLLL